MEYLIPLIVGITVIFSIIIFIDDSEGNRGVHKASGFNPGTKGFTKKRKCGGCGQEGTRF